jgi:hypothetical protein
MGKGSGINNSVLSQSAGRLKIQTNAINLSEKPTGIGIFAKAVFDHLFTLVTSAI